MYTKTFYLGEVRNGKRHIVSPFQGEYWTAGRRGWAEFVNSPYPCIRGWHAWNSERIARRQGIVHTSRTVILFAITYKGYKHVASEKTAFSSVKLGRVVAVYQCGKSLNRERRNKIVKSIKYT